MDFTRVGTLAPLLSHIYTNTIFSCSGPLFHRIVTIAPSHRRWLTTLRVSHISHISVDWRRKAHHKIHVCLSSFSFSHSRWQSGCLPTTTQQILHQHAANGVLERNAIIIRYLPSSPHPMLVFTYLRMSLHLLKYLLYSTKDLNLTNGKFGNNNFV